MNGCDYNTISLEMVCDCSGKGEGLCRSFGTGGLRCDSNCGECNYLRTLLSSFSPPHTIECDFIETGSVDGTSLLPSKAHETDF